MTDMTEIIYDAEEWKLHGNDTLPAATISIGTARMGHVVGINASSFEDRDKLAALLMAAPDMLATLNAALPHISDDAMMYSHGEHGKRIYIKDMMKAAIAKAKGA